MAKRFRIIPYHTANLLRESRSDFCPKLRGRSIKYSRPVAFIDLFSGHAKEYASARPSYPQEVFEFIASECNDHQAGWDCATGSGQAAHSLVNHFDCVHATDASAEQIGSAQPHPRISYSVQPAETTSFESSMFDAVCVAQALHWFDHPKFFDEVKRVLRPGGLFVAFGYDWLEVSESFDHAFKDSVRKAIEPFWAPQIQHLQSGYATIEFPFDSIPTPDFSIMLEWNFQQLEAYIMTWSASQAAMRSGKLEPLDHLLEHWGNPLEARMVRMPLHFIAGRSINHHV